MDGTTQKCQALSSSFYITLADSITRMLSPKELRERNKDDLDTIKRSRVNFKFPYFCAKSIAAFSSAFIAAVLFAISGTNISASFSI